MTHRPLITIFVPAYNEALNLTDTVSSILSVVRKEHVVAEILIIDDGSTDDTGSIADDLSKNESIIRVIHHTKNLGFGKTVKRAIREAKGEYITGLPGDNDTSPDLLRSFIRSLSDADLLIGVMTENTKRSMYRRFLSWSFISCMNLLFQLDLDYYNGYIACRTELLRKIPIYANGFAIFAEIKVRLLRKHVSSKVIPFSHVGRVHGTSKAVSLSSVFETVRTILFLLWSEYGT